jgi:hypothetical protein
MPVFEREEMSILGVLLAIQELEREKEEMTRREASEEYVSINMKELAPMILNKKFINDLRDEVGYIRPEKVEEYLRRFVRSLRDLGVVRLEKRKIPRLFIKYVDVMERLRRRAKASLQLH